MAMLQTCILLFTSSAISPIEEEFVRFAMASKVIPLRDINPLLQAFRRFLLGVSL